jgi:hypothetical protein
LTVEGNILLILGSRLTKYMTDNQYNETSAQKEGIPVFEDVLGRPILRGSSTNSRGNDKEHHKVIPLLGSM